MKKLLTSSLLMAALSVAMTGCLKDKGFENNQYGINDPDTQPPGVGFPLAANAKNGVGVDVTGSVQSINGIVYVNLESGSAAPADIHITLTNTTAAQVTAYNTANGTTIVPLPPAVYTVGTSLTIPAGGRNVQVPINISSTLALDPNQSYAVGLTITGVDGGYKIASNLKDLFIVIGVKNAYDGKYSLHGQNYHPSAAPTFPSFVTPVELWTTGPNTVKIYWPLAAAFASPAILNGGFSYFSVQEPEITVNTATNKVTVQNVAAGASTFYTMGKGFNNAGYNHRWDPATKTIYAMWGYSLTAGGDFVLGTSRAWTDTLIRTGSR